MWLPNKSIGAPYTAAVVAGNLRLTTFGRSPRSIRMVARKSEEPNVDWSHKSEAVRPLTQACCHSSCCGTDVS